MNILGAETTVTNPTTGAEIHVRVLPNESDHEIPRVRLNSSGGLVLSRAFDTYGCGADALGLRFCHVFGNIQCSITTVGGTDNDDCRIWLCPCCQAKIGLRPDIDIFEPGVRVEFRCKGKVYLAVSGSKNFMEWAITTGNFDTRGVDLGDDFDNELLSMIRDGLFMTRRPGQRRGCEHLASIDGDKTKELVMRNAGIREEFERIEEEESKIWLVLACLYEGDKLCSFKHHDDRVYAGKLEMRANLTLRERPSHLPPKMMTVQYRGAEGQFAGHHFEVICLNGTVLDMSKRLAGVDDPDYEHSIWNAKDTITLTYDHGRCTGDITQEEIEAAMKEFLNDDNEEMLSLTQLKRLAEQHTESADA